MNLSPDPSSRRRPRALPPAGPLLFLALLFLALLLAPPRAIATEPADSPDSLSDAHSLMAARKLAPAESLLRRILPRAEAEWGASSPQAAAVLDLLLECLWQGGKGTTEEAENLLARAIQIKGESYGRDHPEMANTLFSAGVIRAQRGDLQGAGAVFDSVLGIRERHLPPTHPDIIESLNALANVRNQEADHEGAVRLFRRALSLAEKNGRPYASEAIAARSNLSSSLISLGEYGEARFLLRGQIAFLDSVGSPQVTASLNSLANIEVWAGNYDAARQLYRRALSIEEDRAGPIAPWTLAIRRNLASVLVRLGEYTEARSLIERQINLLEGANPRDPLLGTSYSVLSNIASSLGDLEEELTLRQKCLELTRESSPPGHTRIAEAMYNLGFVLGKLGRQDEQEELVHQAQRIWLERLGPNHGFAADALLSLSTIARERGDLEEARRLAEEALHVEEERMGESSPQAAAILYTLGSMARQDGRLDEARTGIARALAIVSEKLGADHPLAAEYGTALAQVELDAGRLEPAAERALAAAAVLIPHLRLTLRSLPERQALIYARDRQDDLDLLVSLLVEETNPDLVARVWDAVIRSRAMVLDEMASRVRFHAGIEDPGAPVSLRALQGASRRLANLIVSGPEAMETATYRRLVQDARREVEEAERAWAETAVGHGGSAPLESIGWAEVRRALPEGCALVAYILHQEKRTLPASDGPVGGRYHVLVLPSSGSEPFSFDVGDATGIDALIADWKSAVSRPPAAKSERGSLSGSGEQAVGRILREVLWDPVARHLGSAERVFIVPDGQIHLVNLAALPEDSRGYLIESSRAFHRLSSERELAAPPPESELTLDALILGAPDFDRSANTMSRERSSLGAPGAGRPTEVPSATGGAPGLEEASVELYLFRGRRLDCKAFRTVRFPPLPATGREAEQIVDLLRSSGQAEDGRPTSGRSVLFLSGERATEEAVKRGAAGYGLLHLATHGFFIDQDCVEKPSSPRPPQGRSSIRAAREIAARESTNPLLLSGLALAGANRREAVSPESEDGILTAQEIASLDLSGARLCVLSACETGAGRVLHGEGILGLQRAFHIAGARSLVTSLWPVEDEATRRWMSAFYQGLLGEKLGMTDAARRAGLTVLEERRRRGESPHPFYWAAFVTSGEWR